MRRRCASVGGLLALLTLLEAGCARTLPAQPAAAVLYRDLQRLVTISQAAEWKIDRDETHELLPDALMSVCQVPPAARQELDSWLEDQIAKRGGDVADAFESRGRDMDRVKDLLELTRIQMVLRSAEDASVQDCPFWLTAKENFRGRQVSDDRWQLTLGGGGRGNLVFQDGEQDLSFGGASRLLLGRAFGDRYTVYVGVEAGGQASFPKDDEGNRESVEVDFEVATPGVLRYRMVNSYLELEGAYLATFREGQLDDVASGFRIGVAVGARALLTKWFFPGAAFQVLYDRIDPDQPGVATVHTIRLGFRVALDLNL